MNFYNYMIRNYKTSDSPIVPANSRDGMTSSIIIWSEAALVMPALRPLRNAGRNMSDARKRN